jgi:DNA-binding response OmpR family regulator
LKILIAEDDPDIARLYELALKSRKHEVLVTQDGEKCLEVYHKVLGLTDLTKKHLPFDVVVLDYRMPKKDGMEVAEEILALNAQQRIIFASAFVKDTLEEAIKRLNRVVELIPKPFKINVLVDTIENKTTCEVLENHHT